MKDFTVSIMSCTNISQLEVNVLNTLQNAEKIKCTKNKNRAIAIAIESNRNREIPTSLLKQQRTDYPFCNQYFPCCMYICCHKAWKCKETPGFD